MKRTITIVTKSGSLEQMPWSGEIHQRSIRVVVRTAVEQKLPYGMSMETTVTDNGYHCTRIRGHSLWFHVSSLGDESLCDFLEKWFNGHYANLMILAE